MSVGGDGGGGEVELEVAAAGEERAWISDWISRRKDSSSASACSSRVRARGGPAIFVGGEGGVWDGGTVGSASVCLRIGAE